MPDSNAGGWGAAKIDYNTPSVAELLNEGAKLNEQRNYRNQELGMQKARLQQEGAHQQQEYEDKQYTWAQAATDPTKQISGQTAIDQHAQNYLGNIFGQMVEDIRSHKVDMGQLMGKYQPALQNVAQGHIVAKQLLENGYKQIDDASKDNPNINTAALKQHLFNEVGNTLLDNNGNYRAPDQVDPNRDIVGAVLNSPNAWQFSNGDAQLSKQLQAMAGDERQVFTHNPDGSITTWSGKINPLQQMNVTPDAGGYVKGPPKLNLITETVNTVKDGKGDPMQVIPADLERQYLLGGGSADNHNNPIAMPYMAAWNQYKQAVGLQTTPQTEDLLRRAWAVKYVQSHIQNDFYAKNIEHLPPQQKTTNIFNMGGPAQINDISAKIDWAIDHKPDGTLRDTPAAPFNELTPDVQEVGYNLIKNSGFTKKVHGKDEPLGPADIYVVREGKVKYFVQRTAEGKLDKILAPVDYASVNLANHSGNTTKGQKQQIIQKQNAATQQQQPATHPQPTDTKTTGKPAFKWVH